MARQKLTERWKDAQEVQLRTVLDLSLSDTTVYRFGRLLITSVRLHDVGLVGAKEPAPTWPEPEADAEATALVAELKNMGLPISFGKKGGGVPASGRRVGKRTTGSLAQANRSASKDVHQTRRAPESALEAPASETPWVQSYDEEYGCHYYYNTRTQESVWEVPAEGFVPFEQESVVSVSGHQHATDDAVCATPITEDTQPPAPQHRAGAISPAAGQFVPGSEQHGAASPATSQSATAQRQPQRMLTEEDLLRSMGLWNETQPQPDDSLGTASTTTCSTARATCEDVAGRDLRGFFFKQPASDQPQPQQQRRAVALTALSEEQVLARLGREDAAAGMLQPMPPPPPAPMPPPPSPPPPATAAAVTPQPNDAPQPWGPVPGPAGNAPSLPGLAELRSNMKPSPVNMLTEEDLLRRMGLLPLSSEGPDVVGEAPAGAVASQPATSYAAVAASRRDGPRTPPLPPGFEGATRQTPGLSNPDTHSSPIGGGAEFRQLNAPLHAMGEATAHFPPHPAHAPIRPGPQGPHSFVAPARPPPPPGFHHIPQGGGSQGGGIHRSPDPFHISHAGPMHQAPPVRPPPPGFSPPPPQPAHPFDAWATGATLSPPMPPSEPYGCPPPLFPQGPPMPPPPGFGPGPMAGPCLPYGVPPYPGDPHLYPPQGQPPYGLPPYGPAFMHAVPPPPYPGAFPPDEPHPPAYGPPPPYGYYHSGPPPHPGHYPPPDAATSQPAAVADPPQGPAQPGRPASTDAEPHSGQAVLGAGGDVAAGRNHGRRAGTWTLEELERQLELMAGSMGAEEENSTAGCQQAEARPVPSDSRDQKHEQKAQGRATARSGKQHGGSRHMSSGGRSDGADDDASFYDAFAFGAGSSRARTSVTQQHQLQRPVPADKPPVGEDDGTRRVTLDAATAAYVRSLLPRNAAKYWMQRYSLFSRFDNLVQLDTEGWWSVTPEVLAAHQAVRSRELSAQGLVAMDACCGCGGNVIQMANVFPVVIGVEISKKRVEMARHNASVYEVSHKCQFLCADFFKVAPNLKVDVLFMSPPWGGPKYQHVNTFDVFYPLVGFEQSLMRLLDVTLECVKKQDGVVAAFLPRNTDLTQLGRVVPEDAVWEVERAYVNNKLKGITVYCHPGRSADERNVRLEAEMECQSAAV